jgi:hypothetical protein
MKNYLVNADKKTPEIAFLSTGDFMITGSSRPEDARQFYKPINDWVEEFGKTKPQRVTFTLDLDYINSASTRMILDILKHLKSFLSDPKNFKVVWIHEKNDFDAIDQGRVFEKSLGHTFDFIEKAE